MPEAQLATRQVLADYLLKRFPQINRAELDADCSLLSSGTLDSLGVLELVAFIEENFSIRLQDDDLVPENFDRLSTFAAFVERKL